MIKEKVNEMFKEDPFMWRVLPFIEGYDYYPKYELNEQILEIYGIEKYDLAEGIFLDIACPDYIVAYAKSSDEDIKNLIAELIVREITWHRRSDIAYLLSNVDNINKSIITYILYKVGKLPDEVKKRLEELKDIYGHIFIAASNMDISYSCLNGELYMMTKEYDKEKTYKLENVKCEVHDTHIYEVKIEK